MYILDAMPKGRIKNQLRTPVAVRYDPGLLEKFREMAVWKGTPYQTLMQLWLTERMNKEWTAYQSARRQDAKRAPRSAGRN